MITDERRGLLHGLLAYGLWGVVAAYWKLLADVPAVELVAHRSIWGLGALTAMALVAGQRGALLAALRDPRAVATMALSGGLLALNWGTFVHATSTGRLLDASLGYFVNPLLSVGLATVVLRERLRPLQWLAIVIAALAVAALTWHAGRLPWIGVVLASTFALYGLIRKQARVDALAGSTVETLILATLAAVYLAVLAARGQGQLGHAAPLKVLLLAGTGLITAVPLVLFASAARRLPLSTVGFLQYLAPTGQFLLAVLAYGEPLDRARLGAFLVIWAALALFSVDLYRNRPRASASASAEAPAPPAPR